MLFLRRIHGNFSLFVPLDHTFEKVPSHGGKQLGFCLFLEVAGVEGFAFKNEVFKNLDAKIVLGKVRKSCQTTWKRGRILGKSRNPEMENQKSNWLGILNTLRMKHLPQTAQKRNTGIVCRETRRIRGKAALRISRLSASGLEMGNNRRCWFSQKTQQSSHDDSG